MYTKDVIETILAGIKKVQSALLDLAETNKRHYARIYTSPESSTSFVCPSYAGVFQDVYKR
ncbi:MAG: hypothetical protein CM1200mP35_03110 [Chloroflexota bacterium]|nr:MAG: hypothetical protein CM1200mP35_03110 [Chloroflexota bacterium]